MTDFAWVIEHRLSPTHSPYYWAGNGWSVEHMKAIRFARKEDAERTRAGFDDEFALEHRVAEHGWDNGDGDDPNATITPVVAPIAAGADRVISDLLIASAPYADMDETGRLPKAREQAERLLNEPDLSAKQRYANHYEEQIGFLVERFAEALSSKLRKAEGKYQYQGAWRRDSWHDALVQQIRRHMDKGDPLDVAAYCAFAWHHGWTLAAPHTSAEAALAAAQERVGVLQNVAGETLAALDKLDPLQAVLPVQQANLRAALAGGTAGDGG